MAYVAPEVYNTTHTLATPGGTITFNAATGATLVHDPSKCSGLAMPAGRSTIDDRPQTHGSIVHPTLLAGRRITLGGTVLPRETDLAGRDALMVSLGNALVSILAADGSYTWHDTSGTSYTATVRCEITASYAGGFLKSYLFGLYAADATIG